MQRKKLVCFCVCFLLSGLSYGFARGDILYVRKDVRKDALKTSVAGYEKGARRENKVIDMEGIGEFIGCKDGNIIIHEKGGVLSRIDIKAGKRTQLRRVNFDPPGEIAGKFFFDEARRAVYAVVNDGEGPDAFFLLNRYDISGGVNLIYRGVGEILGVSQFPGGYSSIS